LDHTRPRLLSILIVNFNTGQWLRDCVASLFAVLPPDSFEVLVLDNASADDSVARARTLNLPVRWTVLDENVGFAAANNRLAPQASGDFVCLLNPDTTLTADSLTPLVEYLRAHPDAGIAGPHHLGADGRWQLTFGEPVTLRAEFLYALNPSAFWGRYPPDSPESPRDVAWLAGSCLVFRRSLIADLGGLFDPRFFLNDEDVDLCRRARDRGLRCVYVPARGLVHYGGVSRPFLADERRHTFRSRRAYFEKYYARPGQWLFLVAHGLRRMRDAVSRRLSG
jgi:N-acetylglucosaminyl-diphospho-decaprenol L-rhamnosyltransferase